MTTLDCLTCGACCVLLPNEDGAVRVTKHDAARLPRALRKELRTMPGEWRKKDGAVLTLRLVTDACGGKRCPALVGTVGEHAFCSVHEVKPRYCRAFQVGSPQCLESRMLHNINEEEVL